MRQRNKQFAVFQLLGRDLEGAVVSQTSLYLCVIFYCKISERRCKGSARVLSKKARNVNEVNAQHTIRVSLRKKIEN